MLLREHTVESGGGVFNETSVHLQLCLWQPEHFFFLSQNNMFSKTYRMDVVPTPNQGLKNSTVIRSIEN